MEQSYKEKYEDILARLERAKNDDEVCDERFCCVINEIIPELAESEDEKVRKELISFFSDLPDTDTFRGIPPSKVIAWLEKQKEYESTDFEYVWDRTDCGELTAALDKYSEEAIINMCHAWYDKGIELERKSWLEKQGEKHPDPYNGISFEYNGHIWGMCARDNGVDISCDKHLIKHLEKQCEQKFEMKTAEESLGISSDEYNKIVDECLFGEQKLTEFERGLFDMLTDISNPCTADCVKSHSEKLLSIARKMIALEQKPAWSEEDSFRTETLISVIKSGGSIRPELRNEYVNWLKSIKPQNRWKPSEDDIIILEKVFNGKIDPKDFQATLFDVLEQLKKLKE